MSRDGYARDRLDAPPSPAAKDAADAGMRSNKPRAPQRFESTIRPVPRRERITVPIDLTEIARDSDVEVEPAPDSSVRLITVMGSVLRPALTGAALRALPLDSRAGFVLSLVDGRCTAQTIVDIAGLPQQETIGILGKLLALGAVVAQDAADSRSAG
jgi:hypothetical protein